MKFLKNYTSDVPVSQTIYRIEQVLIRCGVMGITKEYGPTGDVTAVRFHIPIHGSEATVRLPADVKAATDALWLDYADGDQLTKDGSKLDTWSTRKKKQRKDFVDQGARTAWKIIQDWVEIQMSMIQMKQAATEEVFMPYIWNGRETFFQSIRDSGFRGLIPEKTGNGNSDKEW
jgi:hypothetical protein